MNLTNMLLIIFLRFMLDLFYKKNVSMYLDCVNH